MSSINLNDSNQHQCLLSQTFNLYNITDLPPTVEPTWITFAVINGLASPPTIFVNALIIWTIIKDDNIRKSSYNSLLVAFAVTDFIVGLVVEPLYCWYLVSLVLRNPLPCHFTIYSVPALMCGCWTLNTLMLSSVDLYLAIERAQFYMDYVTVGRVIVATASVWVTTLTTLLVSSVIAETNDSLRKLPVSLILAINVLIILYCTSRVQITAFRQRRAIQAQLQAVQQLEDKEADQVRRQQLRQAATMGMLVIASTLCYLPYIITGVVQSTKGKDATDDFQYISFTIGITFAHLQSLVNPMIISLRLSYIRDGVK